MMKGRSRVAKTGRPLTAGNKRLLTVLVAGTAALATARGQTIQPFESSTPTPAATIRRARPSTAVDVPTARAVPVDSPVATERRRSVPTAPAVPARNYPVPGGDGTSSGEPVAPTPKRDVEADAAPPDIPRPTPTPVRRPADDTTTPASTPSTAPVTGAATPGESADGEEIRIAPQTGRPVVSAEETQFNLANRSYVAKDYAQAAAEYERYLGRYPEGKQRQAALWWLAEAYRFLKRTPAARSTYQMLTVSFQDGEFVGPASFRLATLDYEARDYQNALLLFRKSANMTKGQDVKLYSRYSEALCLEQLGRRDETREVYEDILAITKDNPYRDDAHLKLAELAMSQKRTNEAFKHYEALANEGNKPALQADSSLKAGILAHELGQDDQAMSLLTRAISLPGANGQVRGDAMIAQLHLLYDTNKYKELLVAYPTMRSALSPVLQPEAMLMAANSQRQMGQHQAARDIYDELITQFANTPQAPEARYQRVISLYAVDDPNFVREAENFLLVSSDPAKTDQVRLMKADTLFKRKDYQNAALAYATLDGSVGLPAKYKAEAAYRLGYSYAQARQTEKTVAAFTKFLRNYPDHPFVAKALMLRGTAYQGLKNYNGALQDFTEVVNDHKDAKEREVAMAQRALILGVQNETRGMIESFRALLKTYPATEAAPLAHYSIANASFNELKDYNTALTEFDAARQAAPKEYGPKSTLMMIFCEYQLKEKSKLAAEVAAYEKTNPATPVPPTILGWLGQQEYEDKKFDAAEAHLTAAVSSPGATSEMTLALANTRLGLQKWDGALEATGKYLAGVTSEPDSRALGLLIQSEAQMGLKKWDDAQKTLDEVLYIQPEGKLNARALLLRGKMEAAQGKYADAAKSYMSVAVLYDDDQLTPQALKQAAEAFDKAGQPSEANRARDELKARFPGVTTAKVP